MITSSVVTKVFAFYVNFFLVHNLSSFFYKADLKGLKKSFELLKLCDNVCLNGMCEAWFKKGFVNIKKYE
ncbi:hypothetical protein BpHYR1_012189 [Brachionus plicatilis]|uniref:Uncharacterized protein n=1 Tax=Brachionus plicatilis TaxID=10195 RepID=A0A3M7Q7B6_BRAPC|nr:hypothetical protein BpHYR1_012189 [Brachionus plicatilis]